MKPSPSRRQTATVSHSRWLAYATAGLATSLVGARSAEATIHYSGKINERFSGCDANTATFQLDQPGNFIRLRHDVSFCHTDYGGGAYFGLGGLAGASFAGRYNVCIDPEVRSVQRLVRGDLISNRRFLPGGSGILAIASRSFCDGGWLGQFDGKGRGFIGFKFNNGRGDQYGWVRIKMQNGSNINQNFELIDFAYGDVGDTIGAGQKSGHETVTDEGSLGWLAAGAVGLLAWRKSRSRTARLKDA